MRTRLLPLILVFGTAIGGAALPPAATAADGSELLVLSYHDIRDDVADKGDPDYYATDAQNFAAHLDWLSGHGYTPVGLDQVLAAARGDRALPDKAVLLTFDDGLRSAYTHAFPLLRAYGYPAVLAVVTSWIDLPRGRQVDYGHRPFTHEDFLTWEQIREMQASGLIEVASHSHDMHRGLLANPQGNRTPAAITRVFDPEEGSYESEGDYLARIRADLAASVEEIQRQLGVRPRALVWPYAAYSAETNRIADSLGLSITFDLEGRTQSVGVDSGHRLHGLGRLLMFNNPDVDDLAYELRHEEELFGFRGLQVDLDYVYDDDAQQMGRNLDQLIERVKHIRPSHVILQAFADPDGNGSADALYFPNRHLPVRADLFSHVAWQIRTRADVSVFAWLPVLAFELPDAELNRSLALSAAPDEVFRLDPTKPRTRRIVQEIYEDLAINSYFEGLLFHDDAYLRENEVEGAVLDDPARRTRALIDFTHELERAAERWRPKLTSVRNLFARPVLQPESEAWIGQHLSDFLLAYDYTAVLAMPWLEGSREPEEWLDRLVDRVKDHPGGLARTIFTLQTRDWRTDESIPAERLKAQVRRLVSRGVRHLAWYPDDFIADQPPVADATEAMSARKFPYLEP